MKRPIIAALLAAAVSVCCAKDPSGTREEDSPVLPTSWVESYNGKLLLCLSDAYAQWEKSGSLPSYVIWDAVRTEGPECFRAALALTVKMLDKPDNWWDEDITYPSANVSIVSGDGALSPRHVDFSDFEAIVRTQYAKLMKGEPLDSRYTLGSCTPELRSNGLRVMMFRALAHYKANGSFPARLDSWERSYTHSTNNCNIDAPEVKTARDAAWKKAGVTDASTDRQKAVAIFNYARDEWEWENYNNTRRGAVRTIQEKCGNCCDLSHAICAMARLSGLPARYFHAQCKYSSGYIGHVISQIYVDGSWEYADASNNDNQFGGVCFTDYTNMHIYESLDF